MYSLIIHFGINKYELSLTIYIGLLHMYHLSVLPPKQRKFPLIVSRQISIPHVSPNLTDAHILTSRKTTCFNTGVMFSDVPLQLTEPPICVPLLTRGVARVPRIPCIQCACCTRGTQYCSPE